MKTWIEIVAVMAVVWTGITAADWTDARCDIYPRSEDKASAMIPCTFGQRQGAVTITREDGITHNLIIFRVLQRRFIHTAILFIQGLIVNETVLLGTKVF